MKVNYKTNFGDLVTSGWHHATRSPVLMGIMLLVSGFIGWSFRNLTEKDPFIFRVLIWFILTTIYFTGMLIFGFLIWIATEISKKNKTFLTDNTIELTENNIITENRYGRSEFVWDIVQKVKYTRRLILIYTAQSKAIIVPKRVFTNSQEWTAFCNFLESHYVSRNIH